MGVKYDRAGSAIYRSMRWKAVRLEAKRRDGWKCTECGKAGRLEVHHKKPIREAPDLAFDLSNLSTLCVSCHAKATARETGISPLSPARQAWRDLLNRKELHHVGISQDSAPAV